MSDAKYTITLDFKGRDELEKIIAEIGKKHNIPVEIDISKANLGVIQKKVMSMKGIADSAALFTSKIGFVIAGLEKAYAVFDRTVGSLLRAAQDAESADTLLKGALRATGLEVDNNSGKLSEYARQLQQVTIYEDDMMKRLMAEMQNIARFDNTETLMRATKAAIGLSSAFGLDLATAMDLVGKAAAGNTAMLGRYGIILDETKSKADKLNQVIALGENYFGIAEDKARDSAGKVEQLKNAWGDLQEVMAGGVLPVLSGAVDILKPLIESLSGSTTGLEAQKRAIVGQRVEFERLVNVYKELHLNQSRSNEENAKYKRTIGELMSKYSNYLPSIDLEKDAWGKIEVAIGNAREQLKGYIDLSIRRAVIEDEKDKLARISKNMVDKQIELEMLRAEFSAGTKHRTQMVPGVSDPLGGNAQGVNYVEAPSGDARKEIRLANSVEQYQKDIDDLNNRIERKISLIEGITAIEPTPTKTPRKGKEGDSGKTSSFDNDQDSILKRLDDYRLMQEAAFDAEKADKAMRKRQYEDDLKLVAGIGNNAKAKKLLLDEYNSDITKIEEKYRTEREDKEKQHYEQLKFMDSGYYEWKKAQLEAESKKLFPVKEGDRKAWLDSQTADLDKERTDWENKPYADFESQYEASMGHLSELQQLGLITYGEIAKAAWEYYETLKAIVEADGEISADEQEMLDKYRKRAQKAQLSVNRDSDVAAYYNQVKFLDSSYYEWKKARIKEDVEQMQISEDQKATILKQALEQLDDEQGQETSGTKPLFRLFGVDKKTQDSVVQQYQTLASQISSIWSQMYANLDSQKDAALRNLEKRAKNERKSEAWLAAEKDKINEQYEKKAKAMRKTEQKMQIASGLMNTFEGVTNALTIKPAWMAPIMASAIGTLGLINVGYIAAQKFAQGGTPEGLYRGVGTTTSDSNIIAISDQEYIIAADRVRKFGVGFFDAINFGNPAQIRHALGSIRFPSYAPQMPSTAKQSFSSGGYTTQSQGSQEKVIQVTLKCDGRELAKAVARGNNKIIRIN